MDKAQLERMYKHNLKVKKVLFIISMALFGVATALIFAVIMLRINGVDVLLIPEFLSYVDPKIKGDLDMAFKDLFANTLKKSKTIDKAISTCVLDLEDALAKL